MKLAIGSANFGVKYGLFGKKKITRNQILKIEKLTLNSDIKYLDTAHSYTKSEEVIGNSKLRSLRIITKFLLPSHKKINIEHELNKVITKSLNKLKCKKLDTILVHNSKDLIGKNGQILLVELRKLKKRGIVKNIGISIYDPSELKIIWKFWKPDVVQAPFNIFDQRILRTGWIDILKKKRIKLFARSCFLQGMLIGNYKKLKLPKKLVSHLKMFDDWCVQNKISKVKACLDFIRQYRNVYCIILGYDNSMQLNEILKEYKKEKRKIPLYFRLDNLKYIDPRKWK
jgi:aryl-alcohol dehydrogenase-like predicted oxidoreductase